ncbi:hypothetical protein, partial [Streptococcus danieliae]|uniref:hypothetical protein n=1 Tax=Streptococcus danieliae TaxID=747656 RepID=UPI0026E9382A
GLKSYRRIVNKKGSRVNQLWNLFHILGYSALTVDDITLCPQSLFVPLQELVENQKAVHYFM